MLNIPRQSYNTGAGNAAKRFPNEDQRIGVAFRNLEITLGAQVNDGANTTIYTPQDCKLLNFIVVGNPIANATLSINNDKLRIAAAGGNLAAGAVIELIVIEKS